MLKKTDFDFVVIGAGAAGLTAAQYGARSGMETLVIDLSDAGGQALNIFTLQNYPGVFPAISGKEFIKNMEKQAKSFGAKIIRAQVSSIDKIAGRFVIKTENTTITAYAVVIATGAAHRKLDVRGEKKFAGNGVSYCATCDGPFFKNKRILVVGGGDSACEEAFYLASLSKDVMLIHRRGVLRAQKAIQDRVLATPEITVRYNTVIQEIRGTNHVESVVLENTETHQSVELPMDAVFVFIGMIPRTDLVSMLPTDESGYLITNYRMETLVPGMYAAGDVRAKPFRQLITAANDGALAAHQAHEYVQTQKALSAVHSAEAAKRDAK